MEIDQHQQTVPMRRGPDFVCRIVRGSLSIAEWPVPSPLVSTSPMSLSDEDGVRLNPHPKDEGPVALSPASLPKEDGVRLDETIGKTLPEIQEDYYGMWNPTPYFNRGDPAPIPHA
ncbi:Hypothetical predicted protein [Olea europaea subsp. europaea]|uniref:Uncharacterized protein n=1 Tax=Olea europaea subsp. europaea TaxID=158383 RepID=A0A8S0PWT1_OLEEU|nr:Hypothetical predicted protein [Olea europaea subsp. europaea]